MERPAGGSPPPDACPVPPPVMAMLAARSGAGAHEEREVKLRVASASWAAAVLLHEGALPQGPWVLEDNAVFDFASRGLRQAGWLLRLRHEKPLAAGSSEAEPGLPTGEEGRAILTIKEPARVEGGAKVRTEHEAGVDSDAATSALSACGLATCFRYQKRRRVFRLHGADVAVDLTPLGDFVEIEGSADDIDAVAALLGRSRADYVSKSYGRLWLEAHAAGPPDMLFADDPEDAR